MTRDASILKIVSRKVFNMKKLNHYYDGTKLLSMKDLDGNTPEVFMCTSNRTAGKTTYFNRLCINKYLTKKIRKFCLLYRFQGEIDSCVDTFWKDINGLFFPQYTLESENRDKGHFQELFLNDDACGYAIPINCADSVKKKSHLFNDVDLMLFDEFMSETNHYCSDEFKKFMSIHTSIARGNGQLVRYVPVIMVSNPVTLLNPYYINTDIGERLNSDTRFLRGHGYVLEQGYSAAASEAQKASGFNKAFNKSEYVDYGAEGVYLNDNRAFIETPKGKSKYKATLLYKNTEFAVREYPDAGVLYCDHSVDPGYPLRIAVTTDDFKINYIMLKNNEFILNDFKYYFKLGCFRFKDLQAKEAMMKALAY